MATVRCPACNRALNLPENQEAEVVCCPLCRHAFIPPAVPRVMEAPMPVPAERINPAFPPLPGEGPASPRPLEPDEDEDFLPVRRRGEAQRSLEPVAAWMRTTAWFGLVGTLPCCGTTGLLMLDSGAGPTGFLLFLCILVGAFTCIMAGARAFQQQRGFGLAVAGVVMTLLTTSGLTLLCLPVVLKMMDIWPGPIPLLEGNGTCCGVLLVFPSAVIIVCGLIGGVKGLLALMRPGTRELFDREGSD